MPAIKNKITSKFVFILGGARSGKSSYAIKRAKKTSRKVSYIATAQANDSEMQKKLLSIETQGLNIGKPLKNPLI